MKEFLEILNPILVFVIFVLYSLIFILAFIGKDED